MFSALIYARAEQGMVSKCFFWWNHPSGSTTNQAVAVLTNETPEVSAKWFGCHRKWRLEASERTTTGWVPFWRVALRERRFWLIQAEFQISNTQMKIWNQTLQTCDMTFWMSSVSHSHILSGPFHFCPFGRRLGDGTPRDVGVSTNGNQVEWIFWEVGFLDAVNFFKTAFVRSWSHKVEWLLSP